MQITREIEGTWEEILTNATEFSGKRVRLTLLEKSPNREADILQQINIGLSPESWSQYHSLIAKRQAEALTELEQSQLIEISDRLESANIGRMKALIELAELRGNSLDALMQELGISPSI